MEVGNSKLFGRDGYRHPALKPYLVSGFRDAYAFQETADCFVIADRGRVGREIRGGP